MSAAGILRRRLARREQLIRARTRSQNEIGAVLARRLQGKPPCSDLFGVKGRAWLAGLELPVEERESIDAGLRHVAFMDAEIAAVDRLIAQQALAWPEIQRLMTVSGGEPDLRRLIYGRDRRAHPVFDQPQAGGLPRARSQGPPVRRGAGAVGPDPQRGSASARWALVEAAWSVVKQPGPLRAFSERIRARRGHGKAIVATARKLTVLFWCMLTRSEDYAHQRPALTKKKQRQLELTNRRPRAFAAGGGDRGTNRAILHAERALAEQAEVSYQRMVKDQSAGRPSRKVGASATPERA